jgi:hypothetical protein
VTFKSTPAWTAWKVTDNDFLIILTIEYMTDKFEKSDKNRKKKIKF